MFSLFLFYTGTLVKLIRKKSLNSSMAFRSYHIKCFYISTNTNGKDRLISQAFFSWQIFDKNSMCALSIYKLHYCVRLNPRGSVLTEFWPFVQLYLCTNCNWVFKCLSLVFREWKIAKKQILRQLHLKRQDSVWIPTFSSKNYCWFWFFTCCSTYRLSSLSVNFLALREWNWLTRSPWHPPMYL